MDDRILKRFFPMASSSLANYVELLIKAAK
jgi:hypothetical protein